MSIVTPRGGGDRAVRHCVVLADGTSAWPRRMYVWGRQDRGVYGEGLSIYVSLAVCLSVCLSNPEWLYNAKILDKQTAGKMLPGRHCCCHAAGDVIVAVPWRPLPYTSAYSVHVLFVSVHCRVRGLLIIMSHLLVAV